MAAATAAGSLAGKVAIVTGSSRGIGKGIAVELGRAGATVYVTGRKPEQRLNFPNVSDGGCSLKPARARIRTLF